ncbi:MAG: acyl-CoA thioesterase [Deltaproteobacteria bacterium]|nr:acyl-CoA thioesterase [Deltaproteobacteria bacterium]
MTHHVVSVELEVPFHDVDSLQIVWHGHYYKYLEIARTALMRHVGLDNHEIMRMGHGLVMGETQCKHTGVLRYGDRVRVDAWFKDYTQRLCIAYEVRNLTSGKRAARARTVLVTLNSRGELNLATPPDMIARIDAALAAVSG